MRQLGVANLRANTRNACSSVTSKPIVASNVRDIRRQAARNGRNPAEVLMFAGIAVIVGETEECCVGLEWIPQLQVHRPVPVLRTTGGISRDS
jgi:hypothetical protein